MFPLTIAQIVDEPTDRVWPVALRMSGKRKVDAFNAQVRIEHEEWCAHGPDDVVRVLSGGGDRELAAL